MNRRDEGSTVPLILGFFLLGLVMVAGSLASGDAFVKQRDLQSLCDGAAVAAAGSAVDLDRTTGVTDGGALKFAGVDAAVTVYLSRDPSRRGVHIAAGLSPDGRTLTLNCSDTTTIAFGSFFGKGGGITQRATAAARAPVR